MEAAVTGAFSFTGSHVARELLRRGHAVRTLTSHPAKPDWARDVAVHPFSFDDPAGLARSLRGANVLVNSYWMRFPRKGVRFSDAVENTRILLAAAKQAGVKRVVHVSVANAAPDALVPYYRAKAAAEQAVQAAGVSHAIVRPTWIYGEGDVLLNNLAWLLRHLPFFPMVGRGRYRIQPVYVGDVATLIADLAESKHIVTVDAAGPDVFEYREFVRVLKRALGKHRLVVPTPAPLALALGKLTGLLLRDVVATGEEMRVLRSSLMTSSQTPVGRQHLEAWLRENRETVGRRWASDLGRHYRGVDLEPFRRGGPSGP
ncbi:MAG: NAD(P)H-binding protein [Candidatus Thermoplasmatota archaeon]